MPTNPRDKARALLADATPGPDDTEDHECAMCSASCSLSSSELEPTDLCHMCAQDFVERVRPLLAALCDELDRAEAKVARLREALRKTSDLIAANRLVLGEYMDPRYVAQVEDAARAALDESEETT